jgi:Asp/Glu/hydantoin racemase
MIANGAPKIFLIHVAAVSIPPINQCFSRMWPQAKVVNILEDALYSDLKNAGSLTEALINRVCVLGKYCENSGADAIMFTGSAFGPAVDRLKTVVGVPVLKPNEALYDVICNQTGKVALLSTVPAALSSMGLEIAELAQSRERSPDITAIVIDHAFEALQSGDVEIHDRLVVEAVRRIEQSHDLIALGQFSMWSVGQQLASSTSKPIITTPDTAVDRFRSLLESAAPDVLAYGKPTQSGVKYVKGQQEVESQCTGN